MKLKVKASVASQKMENPASIYLKGHMLNKTKQKNIQTKNTTLLILSQCMAVIMLTKSHHEIEIPSLVPKTKQKKQKKIRG